MEREAGRAGLGSIQGSLAGMALATFAVAARPVSGQEINPPIGEVPFPPAYEVPPEAPPAEPGAGNGCGAESPVPNVYLHSGEFFLSAVDLRIPGRGLDFAWARKYRSRLGPTTAQGNGWDYSYNLRIELAGQAVRLLDGNTRRDLYAPRPGGIYTAPQHFREGRFELDGTFTLTFADGGRWRFKELDASPVAGRIESSIDRNGNTLQFLYDGLGRLVQVVDTLGRTITVGYDANGRITTVTDFSGRVVTYAYYGAAEAGGSLGDLKSVRTPPVTGFPAGKTTLYTYSKNFSDERLNHNLLTIRDPKSQVWLVNTYSPTLGRKRLDFDRLVRQRRGNAGQDIKIETELIPLSLVSAERIKVIVNDRVGNVSEHAFDKHGRMTRQQEFTGRANPTQPTTSITNRPVSPLRPDDPALFETRYEYNPDSLVRRVVHPNGNVTVRVYELALNPAANWRTRGNLRELRRSPGTHVPAGDQSELVELFEYENGMGGCCGVSFVKRHVDARGSETLHTYDAQGNRLHTQHRLPAIVEDWEYNAFGQMTAHVHPANESGGVGHRRRDEFVYYQPGDGPQNGHLKQVIVDATVLALTTTFEYDAVGNVVRRIDPRGHDEILVVNALNQVESERSREWTPGSGSYTWKFHAYDANDNRLRTDVENRDENGVLQANALLRTSWSYGILNEVLSETREIDALENAVTIYAYDANRNRTLVRKGEAVNGNQPRNTETTLYDERDLVFRFVRADGDAAQATTQTDYDGNRSVRAVRAGLESSAHVTEYVYDGYDRRVEATDPMGNVTELHYDPNGNLGGDQSPGFPNPFGVRILGETPDVPGTAGNGRLAEATYAYDAMDRLVVSSVAHFDPATQAPIGDGQGTATVEWADLQLGPIGPGPEALADDFLLAPTETITRLRWWGGYSQPEVPRSPEPGAGEPWRGAFDGFAPFGETLRLLDASSGVVRHEDDHGHTTVYSYDTANRPGVVTDPKGNTTTWSYDENGNVVLVVEVDKSDLFFPDRIVTTTYAYDSLDRLIQRMDGLGNTTSQAYDSRGNRVVTLDPRGNETRYSYDGLDRLIQTDLTLTDTGTGGGNPIGVITTTQTWDESSRPTSRTDGNGNTTTYAYDALDRLIRTTSPDNTIDQVLQIDAHDSVLWTQDPNGTVVSYSYDALDRLVQSVIAPGPGVSAATTFEVYQYDGLSRLVYGQDDDSLVTFTYDSMGSPLGEASQTLPGGPILIVGTTCDALGNPTSIVYPGGRTIDRSFDELERVRFVTEFPAIPIAFDSYQGPTLEQRDHGNGTRQELGYDPLRRLVSQRTLDVFSSFTLDQRVYGWDPASNKAHELDLVFFNQRLYAYDSADRLIRSDDSSSGIVDYFLDAAGNRWQVNGGPNSGPYSCDPTLPAPADCQQNQYTYTPYENLTYDANGNLIRIQTGFDYTDLVYDYRDNLVELFNNFQGTLGTYRYDCLDRRIVRNTQSGSVRTAFSGTREIEDQDLFGSTLATYVPGPGGVVLQMQRSGQNTTCHTDDLGSIVLVTDAFAQCAERRRYGDFGETTYYHCFGFPVSQSLTGTPYAYRGMRDELHTYQDLLYSDGWRVYSPRYGRWLQADPLGSWGLDRHRGNALVFAASNPVSGMQQDPPEPRPSVATPDTGGTRSGEGQSSFFDVFFDVELGPPPPRPPSCEGPCEGAGPVRESGPVTEGSMDSTVAAAQKKACEQSWGDRGAAEGAADKSCQDKAGANCLCYGALQGVHGSREEVWTPKRANHGKGWGKTKVTYYSCQLKYVGHCERR